MKNDKFLKLVKIEQQLGCHSTETSLFSKVLLLQSKTSLYALLSKLLQAPLIPGAVTNAGIRFSPGLLRIQLYGFISRHLPLINFTGLGYFPFLSASLFHLI